MEKLIYGVLLMIFTAQLITAQEDKPEVKIRMGAEIGYVAVLDHKIQFSNSGTYINYVTEGGQSNLFPVTRFSLELDYGKKNTFVLLYQPLSIRTKALPERDLVIDELTFPAGQGVNFIYDFPFYRISYLREFLSDNPDYDFAFGATVQIRNANISFESIDGERFRNNTDIGIVPALKLRTRKHFSDKFYAAIEADGIYAPVSYLNGADNEIVGAILDASIRGAYQIAEPAYSFLNVRYLGGGAVGTDPDSEGPGDGYVRNWLNFLTVTAGFIYEFD